MFCKKAVVRNFAKFTEKHLRQSLFFNKVAGLSTAPLLKKRPWHSCIPVNLAKFLTTPFLQNNVYVFLFIAAILIFFVFSSSNILTLWATLQFSDHSPRRYNVKLYNTLLKRSFTFSSTEITLFSSIINTFLYLLN